MTRRMLLTALLLLLAGCSRPTQRSSFTESADDGPPLGYFAASRFEGQCESGRFRARHRGIRVTTHVDDAREISIEQGSCRLDIALSAGVHLSETGLDRLDDGATFDIVETSRLGKRELSAQAGNTAPIVIRYLVDGKDRPVEGDGQAFIAAAVQEIHRSTEVGADERIARLYASGGVDAVLAEVGQLSSSYVRHVYVAKLVSNGTLSDAEHARVLGAVAKLVPSDYELANALVQSVTAWPDETPLPPEFFAAAGEVHSDYEHARVLRKVIAKRPLAEPELVALLEDVRGIRSEYERAEVLTALAKRRRLAGASLDAYVTAAKGIGSQYEQNRALAALHQ